MKSPRLQQFNYSVATQENQLENHALAPEHGFFFSKPVSELIPSRPLASGGSLPVARGTSGENGGMFSPDVAIASPCEPVGGTEARRRDELVIAYADFIELLGPWDWYATLTFREAVHPEQAARRFHRWLRVLNQEVYGRRYREKHQGCWWVRSLEMQKRDVVHFHCLIGGVGNKPRRLFYKELWNVENGFSRIYPYDPLRGARYYCAKYVLKESTKGEIDVWLSDEHRVRVLEGHRGELAGMRVSGLVEQLLRRSRL